MIEQALDVGITFFDTAASYADGDAEQILGVVLKGRRHEVVIATKFGGPRAVRPDVALGSRRHIRRAVEENLKRLQTDYIDLYQCHVPDPKTSIEETLAALDELVKEGKVRYLGSSNFRAWEVVEAEWAARGQRTTRFISAQNRYNLLDREVESELVPACLSHGVGILPYHPLSRGLLTGQLLRGTQPKARPGQPASEHDVVTETTYDRVAALGSFARERSISLVTLAIGWLATRPGVATVMAGATGPEQVRANAAAIAWIPTDADLQAIDALLG